MRQIIKERMEDMMNGKGQALEEEAGINDNCM